MSQIKTINVEGWTFAAPDHELGYTKSYLIGYMKSCGCYSVDLFTKWMGGQTVGVSDSGETIYYYHDVVRYLTQGGSLAKVID